MMFNVHGVLTAHRVPTWQTVNKEYYKTYLRSELRTVIRKRRQELLEVGPLILHDSASWHKADVLKALLEEYNWEVLKHPRLFAGLKSMWLRFIPEVKGILLRNSVQQPEWARGCGHGGSKRNKRLPSNGNSSMGNDDCEKGRLLEAQ